MPEQVDLTLTTGDDSSASSDDGVITDTQNLGDSTASSDDSLKADDTKADDTKANDPPFHEHPRWQEMLNDNKGLREALTNSERTGVLQSAELNNLKTDFETFKQTSSVKSEPASKSFGDLSADERADIVSDPVKLAEFVNDQIDRGVTGKIEDRFSKFEEERTVEQTAKTYNEFSGRPGNEDFMKQYNDGTLRAYMDANPGNNAISAYHELKALASMGTRDSDLDTMETSIQGRIDKAVAEKEASMIENIKAKQGITTLDGTTSRGANASAVPDSLKDTKKAGGLVTSLVQRSLDRMRGTAGG